MRKLPGLRLTARSNYIPHLTMVCLQVRREDCEGQSLPPQLLQVQPRWLQCQEDRGA